MIEGTAFLCTGSRKSFRLPESFSSHGGDYYWGKIYENVKA